MRSIHFLLLSCLVFAHIVPSYAVEKTKQWALYSWRQDDQWQYSLIHRTDHHPDDAELKAEATDSLNAIESRISLLDAGSDVALNPLPVLNLELQSPPSTTLKEFERTCENAKIRWESN